MKKTESKLAEVTISYKSKQRYADMPKITSSNDANEHLRSIWGDCMEHKEQSFLLLLNRANKVLGYYKLSEGGIAGTVVDTRLIFQAALKANSSAIILAHNHPSGNLNPSDADTQLTRRIKEAGIFMEIPLLDHLILCSDSYFSFADEGVL